MRSVDRMLSQNVNTQKRVKRNKRGRTTRSKGPNTTGERHLTPALNCRHTGTVAMPQTKNAETKVAAEETLSTAADEVASAHQKARHTLNTGNCRANMNLAGRRRRGHLLVH